MYCKKVNVKDFRNICSEEIEFCDGVNVISGENAQGKTNLLEAIDDIMVKAGLLVDDNFTIIQSHDGSRVFYDKNNPRTEIRITKGQLADNMHKNSATE